MGNRKIDRLASPSGNGYGLFPCHCLWPPSSGVDVRVRPNGKHIEMVGAADNRRNRRSRRRRSLQDAPTTAPSRHTGCPCGSVDPAVLSYCEDIEVIEGTRNGED